MSQKSSLPQTLTSVSKALTPDRKQVKGKIKEQWGKLSDDDLNVINGRRDQLEGKIQERYGYQKDQAKKDVDDWYNRQTW
jgi:uncharacterized protein YjbJ (UPF0337 family)